MGKKSGMHKSAVSGKSPKSPRFRQNLEIQLKKEENEKEKIKNRKKSEMYSSISQLMKSRR